LYDGSVCVYDRRSKNNKPIYQSFDPKIKHTDPCWQVYWQPEQPTKNTNFFSISTDGRVTNWIMNKNELVNEEVVEVKLLNKKDDHKAEDASLGGLAGASCFDFGKHDEHLFVVGTEEGAVHSYSKAYHSQHLRAYDGHHMAVYGVKWNPFHPRVFVSCSADWTCKIWEQNSSQPVMTFDLSTSVGDVAWAPYSSTAFAAVTSDGRLRLFDLSINKHEAIGETRVTGERKSKSGKARLTHLAFNPKHPIICVGDDRGDIKVFKLTSNLYRMSAPRQEDIDANEEVARLEKLLIIPDKSSELEVLAHLTGMGPIQPIKTAASQQNGLGIASKEQTEKMNEVAEKMATMNNSPEKAKAVAA